MDNMSLPVSAADMPARISRVLSSDMADVAAAAALPGREAKTCDATVFRV
jgi:hypothetical protein